MAQICNIEECGACNNFSWFENQIALQQQFQFNAYYANAQRTYVPVYYYVPIIQYQPVYIPISTPNPVRLPSRPKQIIPIIDPKTLMPINVDSCVEIGIQVDLKRKRNQKSVQIETENNSKLNAESQTPPTKQEIKKYKSVKVQSDFKIKLKFNAESQTLPANCVCIMNAAARNKSATFAEKIDIGQFCNLPRGKTKLSRPITVSNEFKEKTRIINESKQLKGCLRSESAYSGTKKKSCKEKKSVVVDLWRNKTKFI